MSNFDQQKIRSSKAVQNKISQLNLLIAIIAMVGIFSGLMIRWGFENPTSILLKNRSFADELFLGVLLIGGIPLILSLFLNCLHLEFGSDLLAGMSMITSFFVDEYLAGAFVVLMLSGGASLEEYAMRRASSILSALAARMPSIGHKKVDGKLIDIPLDQIEIGDEIVVLPHETCPIDGIVIDGYSQMDESYLSGEPYQIAKAPGTRVISGAMNGDAVLTIQAERQAKDSRYAKIVAVIEESEQKKPRMRRIGDRLGAWYTPFALVIALLSWWLSADSHRFLAVLVVATPCPLLIAIPVALIGAISLAGKRGIIIRDAGILERVDRCKIAIFDKTGTLTYGEPNLTEIQRFSDLSELDILQLIASLERYSKHPLAAAIRSAAEKRHLRLLEATDIKEEPGKGLIGKIHGKEITVTSRKKLEKIAPEIQEKLPSSNGLECLMLVDGKLAARFEFHDRPRLDGKSFLDHLPKQHSFARVLLVSGDRQEEVERLAKEFGISEVYGEQSPEKKLELVKQLMKTDKVFFLGDGINDAPALIQATVGVALGQHHDVTSEAAGAVILESNLKKVDELIHISQHLRKIVLQSAVGGILLSIVAMAFAFFGYLPPVAGAILQEAIDIIVVLNALRAAFSPSIITDY